MAVGPAELRKLEEEGGGASSALPFGGAAAELSPEPLPPLAVFLAQDRGRVRSVQTEVDVASRERKIGVLTFVNLAKYRFYIYSAEAAEHAYATIIDYLAKFGYPDYVIVFQLEYGSFSRSLDNLKRDVGEFEPERIMPSEVERAFAADHDMTVGQVRRAIREFKERVASAGRETMARAKAKPRPNLTSQQIEAVIADSTLGRLQRRYETLSQIKLPASGFRDVKQARLAAKLSSTFLNLQTRRKELGLDPLPHDPKVTEARRLSSAFYRNARPELTTRSGSRRHRATAASPV